MRLFFGTVLVAVLFMFTGCGPSGPSIVPVSGTVYIDGQPLTSGFIQVVPTGSRPATGEIGADGQFTLSTNQPKDGCCVGTHTVTIFAVESINPLSRKWLVPQKYAEPDTSDVKLTVTGPTTDAKVELTWSGGKPFIEKFEKE